jgi:Pregnancy-associated plasma protein-A
MTRPTAHGRSLLAVLAIVALFVAMAPVAGAKPLSDAQCVTYAGIADAPKGKIPRDDLHSVRVDPVGHWIARHPAAARAVAAEERVVTVPVAFHVLRKDTSIAGGDAPTAWIRAQIEVLNDSFSGATGGADTGFRFELASIDRTTKASWFKLFYVQGGPPRLFRGSHKEIQVKQALHEGGPETLNVYTGALGKFLLGWAWFPSDFVGDGAIPRFYDGVVIDYRTMPGADFGPYDEGDTLVHEVGHWLEVFHTFQNACEAPGDFVADTPFEASPAFGCPEGRDTCTQPGLDPVQNFMDYTDDACMFEFTPDQVDRMRVAWQMYRA